MDIVTSDATATRMSNFQELSPFFVVPRCRRLGGFPSLLYPPCMDPFLYAGIIPSLCTTPAFFRLESEPTIRTGEIQLIVLSLLRLKFHSTELSSFVFWEELDNNETGRPPAIEFVIFITAGVAIPSFPAEVPQILNEDFTLE